MTFNAILKDLKARKFKPFYLFDGAEPYFADALTDYIVKHVLTDDEKEFNQTIIYGQDATPMEVVGMAKRFPMMAEYQVVVVREAQSWKSLDAFATLLENPVPTTILVINYMGKKVDGRSALAKLLKAKGVYFNGAKLKDNQVAQWITEHCAASGIEIEPTACYMLSENIGSDLSNLVNALEKLQILVKKGDAISADLVQKNIGISKDFNIFELQRAIGERNHYKALFIAQYFANNPRDLHHIIPVSSGLYRYFVKIIAVHGTKNPEDPKALASALGINPYFVHEYRTAAKNYSMPSILQAVEILHDIDLKSKGINASNTAPGELMREMVSKLLKV